MASKLAIWKTKGNNLADLKLKVLFINLFKTQINADETELIFDKTVYSFVTDKLQLDHMEARRPSENNMVKHFKPKDPYELREKYVESLGNMMILDKDNNNEKNNKPLAEAMGYYENMCVGHWLNKLTTELWSHIIRRYLLLDRILKFQQSSFLMKDPLN